MRSLTLIYGLSTAQEHGAICLLQGAVILLADGSQEMLSLSAIAVVVLIARLAGQPSGGRIADAWPHRRALMFAAVAGMCAAVLLASGLLVGSVAALAGLAAVTFRAGFQDPIRLSAIAVVCRSDSITAHTVVQTARIIAIMASLVVGGVVADVIWGGGAPLAAGWPAVVALALLAIGEWLAARRLSDHQPSAPVERIMARYHIWKSPGFAPTAVMLSLYWGANQALVVCFPDRLQDIQPDAGASEVLGIHAIALLGTISGLTIARKRPSLVSRLSRPAVVTFACLAILPWAESWLMIVPLVLLYGAAGGCLIVAGNIAIQRSAPAGGSGAAFAAFLTAQSSVMLAALATCAIAGSMGSEGTEVLLWLSLIAAMTTTILAIAAVSPSTKDNPCTSAHFTGSTSPSSQER